ncbi:hypothetical protein [Bradyrhizobium sp. NC92]|uniref:hypothetical protein n=1 Tax=Bradyrhizobium sp. (strain NC92) TaxID=55395 RepID=UPI0021AA5843|nr:hypothetical protein [Bradyrhizobium sp. NC92]UWU68218.1 hypothetical protein N2602_34845 [Bradyrhizobium sp. NC92]
MAKNGKSPKQAQLPLLPKSPKLAKAKESEVEAYAFIRQRLRDLGWVVKDPSKGGNGQVWTQNQCLADPQMKEAFGLVRPENVIKLSEKFLWVIEAKATRKELDKALDEATNFYCEKINGTKGQYKALLATGVAGNEEAGYLMRTAIRVDGKWVTVTINKQEATGLLSSDDVKVLLKGGSDVHEFARHNGFSFRPLSGSTKFFTRAGLIKMIAPRRSPRYSWPSLILLPIWIQSSQSLSPISIRAVKPS